MPKEKTPSIEVRSLQEIRGVNDDGSFEGYIAVWDTVDSYESQFMRGAFAKTINERAAKIKVFFDHDELVGKSVEIREDDHGVYVRGQLSLGVQKAQEVYEFLKDGTVDGLSFGFRTIKERFTNGVRQIAEIKLYEYGPVIFPANEAAMITDVRAERILSMSEKSEEQRESDFDETVISRDLVSGGYRLFSALDYTLDDIWYAGDVESVPGLVDEALSAFHVAYLEWTNAYIDRYWESRGAPGKNELASEFADYLHAEEGRSIESMAADSAFTVKELHNLQRGLTIDAREKLSELPESIRTAHQAVRVEAVEALFRELRAGFNPAEKRRIAALLAPAQKQSEPELESIFASMTHFRESLGEQDNA